MPMSTLPLAEIPDFGQPVAFTNGEFKGSFVVRIHAGILGAVKLAEGFAVAYQNLCTHRGGTLDAPRYRPPTSDSPESLVCGPCSWHQTSFDLMKSGLVILGPATQNLPQLRLEVQGSDLVARGWIENPRQTRHPQNEQWPLMEWRPTNAPLSSSRTDDIWFLDESTGWAVNSNGQIVLTEDAGRTWTQQKHLPAGFIRGASRSPIVLSGG